MTTMASHRKLRVRCFAALFLHLLVAPLAITGGEFDVKSGDLQHIPKEWLEKLDSLKLQNDMNFNLRIARREFDMWKSLEAYVHRTGIRVANESSSYALMIDNWPTERAQVLDKIGHELLKLSSQFIYSSCVTKGIPAIFCAKYIPQLRIPTDSGLLERCTGVQQNGSGQTYRRLLSAEYSDGLEKPRQTKHGHSLPQPRNISSEFYEAAKREANEAGNEVVNQDDNSSHEGRLDKSRSVFFVQWSQFVEQDLAHTVQHKHENGQSVECCKDNFVAPPRSKSSSCLPLKVHENDPYFGKFFLQCLNYVRSAIGPNTDCSLGSINQLNMATDALDLSQLYGPSQNHKRPHRDGKLIKDSSSEDQHCLRDIGALCHNSGDTRVNYSPYSILQHEIFQESHNRIAQQLKDINPKWSNDKLFETARKINLAIFQKITYEEWLAMVVGYNQANRIRNLETHSLTSTRVSNEFATAAIRFHYSMLPGDLFEENEGEKKIFELRDTFYQPEALNWTAETRAKILSAALAQKAMALDTSYVDDLNVDLFRASTDQGNDDRFGTDSLALDIMRGRDHGLASYVQYLNACSNSGKKRDSSSGAADDVTTWGQLEPLFSAKDYAVLRKMYHHVGDIDLMVGGIAELPQNDSLVGPTFACIIAEQMDKTRRSDPNFYTRDHRLYQTLHHYSAANLLCDTMNLSHVQKDVFQVPSNPGRNHRVTCDKLTNTLNLQLWADTEQ